MKTRTGSDDGSAGRPGDRALDIEQWRRARVLFAELCDSTPAERVAALDGYTPDDPVRARAERLLASLETDDGFFDEPDDSSGDRPDDSPGHAPVIGVPASPAVRSGYGVVGRGLPDRVGAYELIEPIGEGGFGVVYRAYQHLPVQREVAVKLLRPGLQSPQVLARFTDERRYLSRLDHPDVVRVLDAGVTEDGQLYVVMDLAPGVAITEFVRESGIDIRGRVALMARICRAVHAVHQRAILHRDLKPSNVLVSNDAHGPQPRIIDFGIATALDQGDRAGWTRTGVPMGTPRYASPEQASGSGVVDTRTDVYSLGMMLGEVLCAVPPREPAGLAEVPATAPSKLATAAGDAALARQLRGDLDRIVLKCVAWEPGRRYDSAASLADDLERFLEGRPVLAAPPGRAYVVGKFIGRHRVASVAVAVALVALVAGLGVSLAATGEANAQRSKAESNAARVASIGGFLLETIERNADPDAAEGSLVLDEADLAMLADRAIDGLDDDPDTMLDLLAQIGMIQYKVGASDAAGETFEGAIRHALQVDGGPSERTVRFRIMLHDTMTSDHARRGQAAAVLDEALVEARSLFREDDPRLLSVLIRTRLSTEDLERIVAMYERDPAMAPEDHISALNTLFYRYEFSQDPSRAYPVSRLLYERTRDFYGPDHSLTQGKLIMYAGTEAVRGSPELAFEMLTAAHARSLELFGPAHHVTEGARQRLVRIYGLVGRAAEGIPLGHEGERYTREQYGAGSVQHASWQQWLGVLYSQAGDPETALDLLRSSLAAKQRHWPVGHDEISSVQVRIAMTLVDVGRFDEAEGFARSSLESMSIGRMPVPIAMSTVALARVLVSREELAEARALVERTRVEIQESGGNGKAEAIIDEWLAQSR